MMPWRNPHLAVHEEIIISLKHVEKLERANEMIKAHK